MIFVLSGEGLTDLGACTNGQGRCTNGDFSVGPMTVILEQLLVPRIGFSLRDFPDRVHYINESALGAISRALPKHMQPARSKKVV